MSCCHTCVSVCPPTARRISLGGEGNALYPVLSSYFFRRERRSQTSYFLQQELRSFVSQFYIPSFSHATDRSTSYLLFPT